MRFRVDSLTAFAASALSACEVPGADAALTARSLVQADHLYRSAAESSRS